MCITGKMNCPTEDSGGVQGHRGLLEIFAHPDPAADEKYCEWIGKAFDPAYFNKDEINEILEMPNYGCDSGFDEKS